ncbi:MAG: chemotaxis protein CheX [Polyangia bacterium]
MKQLPSSERLAVLVSNVTQTMLGISFAASLGDQAHPDLCWRIAVTLVDGPRPLTVGLSSSQPGCLALTAAMFSCPVSAVDAPMISDALRELVNMTAGLLKTEMALDQALSLSQVVTDASVLASLVELHPGLVLKAKEIDLALWAYEGRVITKLTEAA